MCQHSLDTSSLWLGLGYRELWHWVSSRAHIETGRNISQSVLSFLGLVDFWRVPLTPSIGAVVVVFPVISALSTLLQDQLSQGKIGICRVMEQVQLLGTDGNQNHSLLKIYCYYSSFKIFYTVTTIFTTLLKLFSYYLKISRLMEVAFSILMKEFFLLSLLINIVLENFTVRFKTFSRFYFSSPSALKILFFSSKVFQSIAFHSTL